MGTTIQQILTTLTTYPGNLIYHMALAFSIAGALQTALSTWRDTQFPQGRRTVIGLGLLLGIRFVLFISAGLTHQGLANPHIILPMLDRAATLLGLLIILWLWVFPEPVRLADVASGLFGALTIIAAALSMVWWADHYTTSTFNVLWLDAGWELYALVLILFGIALLLIRRPNGWPYGLSMLLISAIGHGLHLTTPLTESDFPGFVRLAQMAAYPLLFTLPRRFARPPQDGLISLTEAPKQIAAWPTFQERPRYGIDPARFSLILAMMDNAPLPKRCQAITRAIAETMLADICLIIYPPDSRGQVTILCGYDLIQQQVLPGMALNSDQLPLLTAAMNKCRPLRLPASSTSQDLSSLGDKLGLGTTGHLLAGFVPTPEGETSLGLIVLSPHSDRRWSRDDQNYLEQIARGVAPILQQTQQDQSLHDELKKTQENLASIQKLLENAQAQNETLQIELNAHPQEIAVEAASTRIQKEEKQPDRLKKAEDTIARLQVENRRLGEMVESLISDADTHELTTSGQLKRELKQSLEEISRLKNHIVEMEKHGFQQDLSTEERPKQASGMTEMQSEVFSSIAQDLRQPMSSIVGYTDLLMGESIGILGALQRKFVERIQVSTERMAVLLDDLTRVTILDGEQYKLNPEAVNLGHAIDKAIADTRQQLREKRISLRVDLPDPMPHVHADRDALQQILIHLLQNAGMVSPAEGEIFLRAEIQASNSAQDFILIQIADQGGGIPKEDLPRVFSRLYRTDNPGIEGIGDTGVGLSIAKTLVEAHQGRIWVDTEIGTGSAFNVLLPLSNGTPRPRERAK